MSGCACWACITTPCPVRVRGAPTPSHALPHSAPRCCTVTGARVTPVVAFVADDLPDLSALEPNADEVQAVFSLTLEQLTDPAQITQQDIGVRGSVPVFGAGPAPVWGLTAYILDRVLRELVLPCVERGGGAGGASAAARL